MTLAQAKKIKVGDKVKVKKLTKSEKHMLVNYGVTGYDSGKAYEVEGVSLKRKEDIRPGNRHSLCLIKPNDVSLYVPISVLEKA